MGLRVLGFRPCRIVESWGLRGFGVQGLRVLGF